MKRKNNLYKKICNINNIIEFEHIVSLNTKNKVKVERFEEYYSENIYKIKDKLEGRSYVPLEYNIFFIYEPKLRLIMSQNIEDKVINHLVSKFFLVDIFDNSFIDGNVATRSGKGTHYGIRLVKKYLNEIKGKDFYYLKFDIKKYFYNMDHNITKELIRKKIKDKDVLNILDNIIDSTDRKYVNEKINYLKNMEISKCKDLNKIKEIKDIPLYKKGYGFPIGNVSSQAFATLYLNELDHFIKEKLHIKYYIRYMDDGLLIHEDKNYLKYCLKEIEKILIKYKLEFNVKKTRIDNIKNGIDFLGFRFYIVNNKVIMKLRNNTKKRFKSKVKKLNKKLLLGKIDESEYNNSLASYKGHLKWGNCNNLIYKNIK